MPTPKITLADIAKMAGVSTSTASRALANSPEISVEMKRLITSIAQSHNYRIHLGARNFRLQRSNVAAVVLPIEATDTDTLSNPFVLEFIGALGLELRHAHYNLLLLQEKTISQHAWQSGLVDGYIQLGHGITPDALNDLPSDLPLVVWGPKLPNQRYCSVGIDNRALARQAVEHLIKQGRRRIGLLTGDFGNQDTESYLRYLGYSDALSAAGIEAELNRIVFTDFASISGYQATQQLLVQAPNIDAIFVAHSDVAALAAINALRETGRRIPEEVAVIGFDNISLGMHLGLPLTTVSQEIQTTGVRVLVENLMKQIAGETTESVTIEGKLVIRQSCGAKR